MSEAQLKVFKKLTEISLKKQTQEGLALVFSKLSCKGVANEIKKGRNVVGNVEYGIRYCVHEKVGPRYNVETGKFIPQSKKGKEIEKKFIEYADKLLKSGGFPETRKTLLADLRKGDREFEKRVKSRSR